jgi:uncharacterized protein (DUF1800 family)
VNRNTFFEQLFNVSSPQSTLTLETHDANLSLAEVMHLLRRTCFSIDYKFAKTLVGKKATDVVAILLENHTPNPALGLPFNLDSPFIYPDFLPIGPEREEQRFKNVVQVFEENELHANWWIDLAKVDQKSLTEKMTFFWHSHFTTEYKTRVIPAQWMHRQNVLFRALFLSNIRLFLEQITVNGAMLLYLNGTDNKKNAPNENYARELFELYSIGIGEGNYTEEDVQQAAKVLTGWRANHYKDVAALYSPYLVNEDFSTDEKTVFGEKIIVDYEISTENVRKKSINKLIDVILSKKGNEVSLFMAKKFYNYFVYSKPINNEPSIISELTNHFRSSGFDVKSTIVKLLTSKHFFDPQNMGVQIKTPLENILGFNTHFKIPTDQIRQWLWDSGLEPFNPPDVSGWNGYRSWITTKTLPNYIFFFNSLINDRKSSEIADWAEKLDGYNDSASFVYSVALILLGRIPKENRVKSLELSLLGSAPYYEWPMIIENKENAGIRIKVLLKEVFKLPEFYLA